MDDCVAAMQRLTFTSLVNQLSPVVTQYQTKISPGILSPRKGGAEKFSLGTGIKIPMRSGSNRKEAPIPRMNLLLRTW
jgi:hypothetical protein